MQTKVNKPEDAVGTVGEMVDGANQTEVTQYMTSKEECERNIKGVCEGCGGSLSAIETVDNSGRPTFWQGCEHCSCFRSGIEAEYFMVARKLVEEGKLIPYSHMGRCEYENSPERLQYYFDCQTAGLSHRVKEIHKLLEASPPPAQPEPSRAVAVDNGATGHDCSFYAKIPYYGGLGTPIYGCPNCLKIWYAGNEADEAEPSFICQFCKVTGRAERMSAHQNETGHFYHAPQPERQPCLMLLNWGGYPCVLENGHEGKHRHKYELDPAQWNQPEPPQPVRASSGTRETALDRALRDLVKPAPKPPAEPQACPNCERGRYRGVGESAMLIFCVCGYRESTEPPARVAAQPCPGCGHASHRSGDCLNIASDGDCDCRYSPERDFAAAPAEGAPERIWLWWKYDGGKQWQIVSKHEGDIQYVRADLTSRVSSSAKSIIAAFIEWWNHVYPMLSVGSMQCEWARVGWTAGWLTVSPVINSKSADHVSPDDDAARIAEARATGEIAAIKLKYGGMRPKWFPEDSLAWLAVATDVDRLCYLLDRIATALARRPPATTVDREARPVKSSSFYDWFNNASNPPKEMDAGHFLWLLRAFNAGRAAGGQARRDAGLEEANLSEACRWAAGAILDVFGEPQNPEWRPETLLLHRQQSVENLGQVIENAIRSRLSESLESKKAT